MVQLTKEIDLHKLKSENGLQCSKQPEFTIELVEPYGLDYVDAEQDV